MSDFSYLARYKEENERLLKEEIPAKRMVFLGDSITEFWKREHPAFFENMAFVNRGISGQTTPQLLGRFQQDVLELYPKRLHLLAGTNDIAGNTGEMTQAETVENIRSMIQQAQAHNMEVLLGAVLPADVFHWRPTVRPLERILLLNKSLQALAQTMGIPLVDYHSAMCDEKGAMRIDLADDGVHPNANGYRIMEEVLSQFL